MAWSISGVERRYCDVLIDWQAAIPATIGSAVTASGSFASIAGPAIVFISHEQAPVELCCSAADLSAVSRLILRPRQRIGLTTRNGDE
jgi:hypothetical protein